VCTARIAFQYAAVTVDDAANQGHAIVRLDRIKGATDKGEPVVAGEIPVSVQLPPNVTYGWPGEAGPDDDADA